MRDNYTLYIYCQVILNVLKLVYIKELNPLHRMATVSVWSPAASYPLDLRYNINVQIRNENITKTEKKIRFFEMHKK